MLDICYCLFAMYRLLEWIVLLGVLFISNFMPFVILLGLKTNFLWCGKCGKQIHG